MVDNTLWEGEAISRIIASCPRVLAGMMRLPRSTCAQFVQDAVGDLWNACREKRRAFHDERELRHAVIDEALQRILNQRAREKRFISKDEEIESDGGGDRYSRFDYLTYTPSDQIEKRYAKEITFGLARLPEPHRTIAELVGEGRNIAEIGVILHLRPFACVRKLHQARQMLWHYGLIEIGIDFAAGVPS